MAEYDLPQNPTEQMPDNQLFPLTEEQKKAIVLEALGEKVPEVQQPAPEQKGSAPAPQVEKTQAELVADAVKSSVELAKGNAASVEQQYKVVVYQNDNGEYTQEGKKYAGEGPRYGGKTLDKYKGDLYKKNLDFKANYIEAIERNFSHRENETEQVLADINSRMDKEGKPTRYGVLDSQERRYIYVHTGQKDEETGKDVVLKIRPKFFLEQDSMTAQETKYLSQIVIGGSLINAGAMVGCLDGSVQQNEKLLTEAVTKSFPSKKDPSKPNTLAEGYFRQGLADSNSAFQAASKAIDGEEIRKAIPAEEIRKALIPTFNRREVEVVKSAKPSSNESDSRQLLDANIELSYATPPKITAKAAPDKGLLAIAQ